jgi:hypothetical protein
MVEKSLPDPVPAGLKGQPQDSPGQSKRLPRVGGQFPTKALVSSDDIPSQLRLWLNTENRKLKTSGGHSPPYDFILHPSSFILHPSSFILLVGTAHPTDSWLPCFATGHNFFGTIIAGMILQSPICVLHPGSCFPGTDRQV